MTLREIPRGSKLRVTLDGYPGKALATFHNLDGMYSRCTLDDNGKTFHLHFNTPLKLVDGAYEIDSSGD